MLQTELQDTSNTVQIAIHTQLTLEAYTLLCSDHQLCHQVKIS